ncbi:zinc-binding dehydrogenase [Actinomadura napierensis]|uniref:Alcohol dehydrogenase-like C-terminal domain-containing protein n=1 Tax=Actinomadura napierensis TaxID=267854 RepID=A0ABP5K955_9ACTN
MPFADTSVHRLAEGVLAEDVLMLADVLSTGYEVGVLNGHVAPGDVVAVVGAGPIGLSTIMGARLFSPSRIIAIDLADSRLAAAKGFGADILVNNSREDPAATVRDLTGGLGAEVTVEAVGVPDAFELAVALARPSGRIANIGVHGEPAPLHLEEQWIRDVTITTGLVDTFSTPTLLCACSPAGNSTPDASSPTTSTSTSSPRPTRSSPTPPTRAPSRSSWLVECGP